MKNIDNLTQQEELNLLTYLIEYVDSVYKKMEYIKSQSYELASSYRDKERNLEYNIKKCLNYTTSYENTDMIESIYIHYGILNKYDGHIKFQLIYKQLQRETEIKKLL